MWPLVTPETPSGWRSRVTRSLEMYTPFHFLQQARYASGVKDNMRPRKRAEGEAMRKGQVKALGSALLGGGSSRRHSGFLWEWPDGRFQSPLTMARNQARGRRGWRF